MNWPNWPHSVFGPNSLEQRERKDKNKEKMMGWIENWLKKSGGNYSSVNTFTPKQTPFLLDLSIINTTIMYYSVPLRFVVLPLFSLHKICSIFDTKFLTNSHILWKLGKIGNTRLARNLWHICGVCEIFVYCTVPMNNFSRCFVSHYFPAPYIWQGAYIR